MKGPYIKLTGGGGGGGSRGIQKVANSAALAALSPSAGDFAIQLDTNTLYYYNGSAWEIYLDDSSYDNLLQVISDLSAHIADATDAHDASAISNVAAGTIAATDVQAAINELDGDIQGHIADATDAHDASAISNVAAGTITATDVQAAINELDGDIQGHINDTTAAHAASSIGNTPAGTISATNVQSALNELDGDVQAHLSDTTAAHAASAVSNTPSGTIAATDVQAAVNELDGDIQGHINDTTDAHDASAVSFDDTIAGLGETDVQGAIVELNNRIDSVRSYFPLSINVSTSIGVSISGTNTYQRVQGSGGPVTATAVSASGVLAGYTLTLLGINDTNTVTIDSSTTGVVVKGSCTLGNNDSITFVYNGTTFIELCRNT